MADLVLSHGQGGKEDAYFFIPYFLMDAAHLYQNASHTFKLVDGAYIRSAEPWDGEYSGEARDRVEACLLYTSRCV